MGTPLPPVSRIAEACSLSPLRRGSIAEGFFGRHPGSDRGTLGLGRAVVEFLEWEVTSGRVRTLNGSSWWQVVNGLMMLDLRDAEEAAQVIIAEPTAPVGAWIEYTRCGPESSQEAFWHAHQLSLMEAADAALPLLAHEPDPERRFTRVVLDVTAQAAAFGVRTDTGLLGTTAREMYPSDYPIGPERVTQLRDDLVSRGVLAADRLTSHG